MFQLRFLTLTIFLQYLTITQYYCSRSLISLTLINQLELTTFLLELYNVTLQLYVNHSIIYFPIICIMSCYITIILENPQSCTFIYFKAGHYTAAGVKNYCLISFLSIVSKIIERLIFAQTLAHLLVHLSLASQEIALHYNRC